MFRTVFFGEASRRKQSVIHEVLTRSALTDTPACVWSAAWARRAASVTSPKREKEMCLAQVPVGFSVLTQVARRSVLADDRFRCFPWASSHERDLTTQRNLCLLFSSFSEPRGNETREYGRFPEADRSQAHRQVHGLREHTSSLGRGSPAPRQPVPADRTAPPCPRAVWPLHASHFESLMKAAPAPLQRL